MTEDVFKSLKNRNNWRDKLAVRVDWNANGQYVTMDIPAGQKIEVWSGKAASQPFDDAGKSGLWYEGGAEHQAIKFLSVKKLLGAMSRMINNYYLDVLLYMLMGVHQNHDLRFI